MNASLKSHFLNLYSMALADIEFDETEIAVLYRLGESRGIPRNEIDTIILNPSQAKFHAPQTIEEKVEYLYDYARMILADGKVEHYELKTLEKFCSKFDFRDENIPAIIELLVEAAKNNVATNELLNHVTQTA